MELLRSHEPLLAPYSGCLSVKRGVEHRLAFRARRGFRYDTLVQVEVFKHVLDQFEQQVSTLSFLSHLKLVGGETARAAESAVQTVHKFFCHE